MDDRHLHFTGSLPAELIWTLLQLVRRQAGVQTILHEMQATGVQSTHISALAGEQQVGELALAIPRLFGNDKSVNSVRFALAYQFMQAISRCGFPTHADMYEVGLHRLTYEQARIGITSLEIVAGMRSSVQQTLDRIAASIVGIQKAQAELTSRIDVRLRLTLIRGRDTIENTNLTTFELVLRELKHDSHYSKWISGFDICGLETPESEEAVFNYIRLLSAHAGLEQLSVHAGEHLYENTLAGTLRFLHKLYRLGVTRLVHGAVLWIPSSQLLPTVNQDTERRKLLFQFAERGLTLDLCPTASQLLSPLQSVKDIPVAFLRDLAIKVNICTDNPTLFGTNARLERASLNQAP